MVSSTTLVAVEQRRTCGEREGFLRVDSFADARACAAMPGRVVDIARVGAAGGDVTPEVITPEINHHCRAGTTSLRDVPVNDFMPARRKAGPTQ